MSCKSFLYLGVFLSYNSVTYQINQQFGGIAMLLSIISSSAISSSAISMITSPGLPQYGAAVVVGLIVLLSLKEILSASEKWSKALSSSFNLAISPLFFSFALIVFYSVAKIV
jgi:hypothetical protein